MEHKDSHTVVSNENGSTLGYNVNSGVSLLTVDRFAFNDLNKNGIFDVYEDYRKLKRPKTWHQNECRAYCQIDA
ncbi:hypothetical protein [Ulvibacterium sp.]|uniref:hypothetical protein n=1 Tax=Ulvibacterium sp. TaxID=2665914 RepID=UPI003CC65891